MKQSSVRSTPTRPDLRVLDGVKQGINTIKGRDTFHGGKQGRLSTGS